MKTVRGRSSRKISLSMPSADHADVAFTFLPFPITSVSTILLIFLCLSTLSAIYIGAARGNRNHHDLITSIYLPGVAPPSGISAYGMSNHGKYDPPPNNEGITNLNEGPTILSLRDLTPSELHPRAGPNRHIVSPPPDESPVTLVTCTTTAGNLHVLVHPSWAPLGAGRFLEMVNSKYFHSKIALMRCVKNFLCQFGIAGDPTYNKRWKPLKDDPNWLPEGPSHRKNELGVKRFGRGYLAYAGAGPNSRTNQFILALGDNERLGGGSPWEVPWGEIVGEESFQNLERIYTGYGEKGPSQGRLGREGSSDSVKKDFPMLDYILGCVVIDSRR